MRILIFGGAGQLGVEVRKRAIDLNFETIAPVSSEVDITELDVLQRLVAKVEPEVVINCAAYTQVDLAEEEKQRAFAINAEGPRNIALSLQGSNAKIFHVSTDYVFPGDAKAPLKETDPTGPLSVYGASKLKGEQELLELAPSTSFILRTSWLHGKKGPNFVHTMLKLFREKQSVKVVNDQFGCPTWTGWLAEAILDLARTEAATPGVFHATCSGTTTWYEYAKEILSMATPHCHDFVIESIEADTSDNLNRAAKRPAYSVLDTSKLTSALNHAPMTWQEGLARHLTEYLGMSTDSFEEAR